MAKDAAASVELEAGKLSDALDRAVGELAASFAGIPFPVPPDDRPTIAHARAALARAEERFAHENFTIDGLAVGELHVPELELDPVVTVATMLLELLAIAPADQVHAGHATRTSASTGETVHEVTYVIESFPLGPNLPTTSATTKLTPAGVDTLFKSIATGPRLAGVQSPVSPVELRRVVQLWRKAAARRPSGLIDPLDVQCASFADWLHGAANLSEPRDGDAQVARLGAALEELDEL